MPHLGTLRSYKFTEDVDDIRGSKLYGRDDDKLGEISDVIFDHETGDIQYAVVDTGGWFRHKEFLVPADQINVHQDQNEKDNDDRDYKVNLSKEQIERFPKYNADDVNDRDRFGDYEKRYREQTGEYFASSGILHRADSANVITPPGMPATGREDLPLIDARLTHHFSDQTAGPMNTSPTAWGRSTANEDRLKPQSDISLDKPDMETTDIDEVDASIAASDRNRNTDRVTASAQPFRNAEVGAADAQSDRLEKGYAQRDADEYQQARSGERIPGEFSNQGSSVSTTEIPGNSPNTSDSELRTAEGDAVFNNADQQSSGFRKGPVQERSATGTSTGSRVGARWDRFQNRLREEREHIAHRPAPDPDKDKNEAA